MPVKADLFTKFIAQLALSVAALIAAIVPLGYALTAYYDLSESLNFKAQVKATALAAYIATSPEMWSFAENRIQGLISREPVVLKNELVQVIDAKGELITSAGTLPPSPNILRSAPLYDNSRIVGQILITGSLRDTAYKTTFAAALGLVLGALILFALRTVPLRALKKISNELFEEKERAEITLHSIGDAIITCDTQQIITYANPIAVDFLGIPLEKLRGQALSAVVSLSDSETGLSIPSAITAALETQTVTACDGRSFLATAHGVSFLAIEERASPIFDHAGHLSGGVLCLRDVSVAREYLQRRSWEASHDLLTGLVNRREFENRASTALTNAQLSGQRYVVCYMDLDRFKVVNDSCGHAAGDELLMQLTQLMQSRVRDTDTLARLGGDEFGLLLDSCDPIRGQTIANELLSAISEFQFNWEGQIFTVGISIGLSTITGDNFSVSEVLGEADSACYWAKEQGRNRVCVYLASDMDLAARRSETGWVGRISAALTENRFVLYHQTYRTLSPEAGSRLHLEVLLRMIGEDHEIIAPGRFLPAAERYNLMPDIDRWVINKVFSEYHTLLTIYPDNPMININLSGASINSMTLLEFVQSCIAKYDVDPNNICFEVTETVAVKHLQSAIEFINACKATGIKFALDDFGTGTSSFGYLRNLPVDYLKIDGSFVRNMQNDAIDRAMTETINRIGHLMGKITVAEFAENEATIDTLREMGVDYAQGYGVCEPKPLLPKPAIESAAEISTHQTGT